MKKCIERRPVRDRIGDGNRDAAGVGRGGILEARQAADDDADDGPRLFVHRGGAAGPAVYG